MPSGATLHLSHFYLYLDGALESEMQDDLLSVTIESSLHLPDTATLVLNDPNLKWVDHEKVMPGKQLKILAESGAGPATILRANWSNSSLITNRKVSN